MDNVELVYECSTERMHMSTKILKLDKEREEEGKQNIVYYRRRYSGHKKNKYRRPNCSMGLPSPRNLYSPNQLMNYLTNLTSIYTKSIHFQHAQEKMADISAHYPTCTERSNEVSIYFIWLQKNCPNHGPQPIFN